MYRHRSQPPRRSSGRRPRPAAEQSQTFSRRSWLPSPTILFLAANPSGTDRRALDREAHAIQVEIERSSGRNCFKFETRWAVDPLDLLREVRKLKPTVVHFSGQTSRDPSPALFFQDHAGHPHAVAPAAFAETLGATGESVKLVVLSACYTSMQADALLEHVDCVVGMNGSIGDDAARCFAIGFYGGLAESESLAAAYRQGCAAIRLLGLSDGDPQLRVRAGVDAHQLVLAARAR